MDYITRHEMFLHAAAEGEPLSVDAVTREELYLAKIAGADVTTPEPVTRIETYLAKIAGADVVAPEPVTRVELYLAAIAGEDVTVTEPVTREEMILAEWLRGGLPEGYRRIAGIKFDGNFHYETGEVLTGDDDVTMTLEDTATTGQNVFGSYNGTGTGAVNFSLYLYGGGSTSSSHFRYGGQLVRPKFGSDGRTITFGKNGTVGFATDVTVTPEEFTTEAEAYIGMLPNSTSPAYTGAIVGDILVGNRLKYVPCVRESDNVIGYYEKSQATFIEPTGDGTPSEYIEPEG